MKLGFPDESGGIVGSQAVAGIPQYIMIFKYDLKGYSEQEALPDEHQKPMYASVEAVDGYIVLNFKRFIVETGEKKLLAMVPITSSMSFLTLLAREMSQTGAKMLIILSRVEPPKFIIPIKASVYLAASWKAWHGDF